jgi:hypothetical protein
MTIPVTNRTILHALAAVFACAASQVAYTQVAVSSKLQLGVYADANQYDQVSHSNTFVDQHFGTLNPFSHSISVVDLDNANGGSLTVSSAASANWVSAGEGSVAWRGMGWSHNTFTSSGSKLNDFVIPGPVWSYTFQATTDGAFSMHYDVRGFGNVFGLLGAVVQWSGPGGNLDLTNPYTPAANGTFVRALTAGSTYTVGLSNMGNVFTAPLRRNDFGYMDADFNWNISAVPEPSSMAILAISVAALLRRWRR